MKKAERLCCFLLSFCLLFPLLSQKATGETIGSPPSVSAKAAILMEAESGAVIYSQSADFPLPMASTTKIMTALVALELCAPETVIAVSSEAVGVEGSSVYLTEKEELTLEALLYALLLESANDAAIAIAVGVCGSTEAFAKEMNRKGAELGLKQTHFENPHGLDADEHFTTAYELALITRAALANDLFAKIVATRKTTIDGAEENTERLLINHNKMLRFYEGCIGVKTGFTKTSGRCLVSAATKNGVTLIAVTLNAPDDWNDHRSMLDYGFSKYQSVILCLENDYSIPLTLTGGTDSYVMVKNPQGLTLTMPASHGKITSVTELPPFEYAPVQMGEHCGRVVFYCDLDHDGKEERIGQVELIACYTVEKQAVKKSFWQWLKALFGF